MSDTTKPVTRRTFLGTLISAPVIAGIAGTAEAMRATDRAEQLRQLLAALNLPDTGAILELAGYAETASGPKTTLRAMVSLTWTPGTRKCAFRSTHADPAVALSHLSSDILTYFATLNDGRRP